MKKSLKIIAALLAAIQVTASAEMYQFAAIKQEAEDNIVEIEAEDFVRGEGFTVVEDATASGGKCIVGSGDETKSVEIEFKIDDSAKWVSLHTIHKAEKQGQNLSYIKINHFENYSLYDYKLGEWNTTRQFLGELDKGTYTVKLTSVRAGQKIDKLILKYNNAAKSSGGLAANAIDETKTYIKGNDTVAALNIKESEEKVPGSFYFEVEEGNISSAMRIGEDESASGGKYWYAPTGEKLTHLTESDMTDEIFSRFKFNVSRKGTYKMWIRYNTPQTSQKSTWFAVDDQNYWRLEDNVVGGWKWKNTTVYLDTGWHTLDIKYRQPGQMIDCIVLTDVAGYSANGMGSLPGEEIRFDSSSYAKIEKVAGMSKIKANNYRTKCDCPFVVTKSEILVPATNLFNPMAVTLEEYDDYYIAKQGRKYIKFYMDSERAIINGEAINTGTKAYRFEGAIPMIPLSAAKKAFGFDYDYNEKESTLNVFHVYDESYREAKEGEIKITPLERFFSYEIPCSDPTAKCKVWYKYELTDTLVLSEMNYDNMNTIKNGGIDYKYSSNQDWYYWIEAAPPVYKDGAFRGSGWLMLNRPHDVKVTLTIDGVEDTFVAKNAFTPLDTVYNVRLSPEEYAPDTQGELLLVPTFENISYYIDCEAEGAECEITYRKKGDEEWKKAFRPVYDSVGKQFRGSIVYCTEGGEYEVKAVIKSGAAVISEKTADVKLWTTDVPVAKEIKLSEIYDGDGPLLLQDMQGTEDGWIKIIGDENMNTVEALKTFAEAVLISNCKYLIFEGITVRGGKFHGINIHGKSENVRIINCDISDWGNEGIMDDDFGLYAYESYASNNYGGVHFYDVTNVVIERCYIHDTNIRTNPWDTDTYKNVHPKGGTGIQMLGKGGIVIRYNDVIGSDKHRFNDVMEGTNNGGRDAGSIGRDADVYGNMMIYSEDDSIELDGGQMNLRVFNNRIEQSRCGISTAPCTMGPNYLFSNLITNLGGSYNNAAGSAIKAGGSPDKYFGIQHFINNTMDVNGTGPANITWSGSSEYHAISRNNIFVSRAQDYTISETRMPLKNIYADERDDFDYDLLSTENYDVKEGDEQHAIVGVPTYVDYSSHNFRLTPDSLGYGKGEYLDNFAEFDAPNMGAYQESGRLAKNNLPYRPVDMYAERIYEKFTEGEEREIIIHVGDIGEGHSYSIKKNRDFDWLEIISDEGVENVPLKPNSTIKFRVKGDLSECEFEQGKGLVLFRLENGFSVPVTLLCERK